MNTGNFCKLVETTRDTLRFYDDNRLLIPRRQANGYRQYTEADAVTFRIIRNLQHAGLTLNEIKLILKLRSQPVTSECRADTLATVQKKQSEFQKERNFYDNVLKVTDKMVDSLNNESGAEINVLIDQLGKL